MEFKKLALVDPRHLQKQYQSFDDRDPVRRSLTVLDTEMNRVLNSNVDDDEKVLLYNQVLSRYRDVYAKSQEPATLEIRDSRLTAAAGATAPSLRMREEILHYIPKTFKTKAVDLLDRIDRSHDITWNDKGELVVKNQVVSGSHIVDLVGDIIWSRQQDPPTGWREFADALIDLHLPSELVGNSKRLEYMKGDSSSGTNTVTPVFTKSPVVKRKIKSLLKWDTPSKSNY